MRQLAVDKTGDALAASGTTFASDDDPELIRGAAPFSLKLMESLLAERPQHQGLLLATTSGFTQYTYAFVQQDADRLETTDLSAAAAARERAKKLYRRARDYGLRGLDVAHAGFSVQLRTNPQAATQVATKEDVALLYWTAASWGGLISLSKDSPDVVAELPSMEALVDRALELDETFDSGAIHSFLISYEMVRPGAPRNAEARARAHFQRAVELSNGQRAAPYVALAESVSIATQNQREFETLLAQAVSIDPDARPEWRLANTVLQQRARWLLDNKDQFFAE